MKPYFKDTIELMNKLNIDYLIGSDSLLGLGEGDLFKYSKNLKIYIKNNSTIKMVLLFLLLINKKIILKPKIENKNLLFKLRYKSNLLSKDNTWIKFYIMKKNTNFYFVKSGNQYAYFKINDMNLKKYKVNDLYMKIPLDIEQFIINYKKELLFDFYINHNVNFNSKNEKKAIKLLFDIKDIFDELSIDYWIEGGTLLGAVRDKKLIPWDHDIDMGTINKSNQAIGELIQKLKKNFYVSVKSFDKIEGVWNLGKYRVLKVYPKKNIFFKKKLCVDIFIYYKDKDFYKYVVWNKNASHKKEHFDNLEQIDFYGKKINVPSNYKTFLQTKYGSNWMTPNKEWNVALDDGSVIK